MTKKLNDHWNIVKSVLIRVILVNWKIVNDFNQKQAYSLGYTKLERKTILAYGGTNNNLNYFGHLLLILLDFKTGLL